MPPVWVSSRQDEPYLSDSQLMPARTCAAHTHTYIQSQLLHKRTHSLNSTHIPMKLQRPTSASTHKVSVSLCYPSENISWNLSLRGLAPKKICRFTTTFITKLCGIRFGSSAGPIFLEPKTKVELVSLSSSQSQWKPQLHTAPPCQTFLVLPEQRPVWFLDQ